MLLLRNVIQDYDWGPVDGLVPLVGCEATGDHQAELWVGTHERGPSVVVGGNHDGRPLSEVIAEDPRTYLGPELADAGAAHLPFLLKVLAIGEPLSLQAHPSAEQADAGYDREEAAGIAIDGPDRTYRDRSPKPEALVALVETWALCGFRPPLDAAELIEHLGVDALAPLVATLRGGGPDVLRNAFAWLLGLDGEERDRVATQVAAASAEATAGRMDRADPRWWVTRLAASHPDDPTCLAPLLMEVLDLAPGEAVHLPAGNLHAYLEGGGVEIMAASDNVLRGGLTDKHIDVDGLLAIIHFAPGLPARPSVIEVTHQTRSYDCGEAAFILTRIDPTRGPATLAPVGPSLLLAVGGDVDVTGTSGGLALGHGNAAFVAPGEGPLLVTGSGTLWWATVAASPAA
jgi:mannose-6-phosphate isomerase